MNFSFNFNSDEDLPTDIIDEGLKSEPVKNIRSNSVRVSILITLI